MMVLASSHVYTASSHSWWSTIARVAHTAVVTVLATRAIYAVVHQVMVS